MALATARDQLLHDHLAGADERGRPVDELLQLLATVGPPGLLLRLVDEVVLDHRFDRPRRLALHVHSLSHPDPGYLGDPDKRALYAELLDALAERTTLWAALPREVAA